MAQILVVDDEVGIRELLSEILEDEGHQVALAESAGDARRIRERARPDLVLLDIWMPDTDGITLLKEWAASGQLTMPVVMMSGHGTIETAVEATKIGAFDFLEKPVGLQKLLATVTRALKTGVGQGPRRISLTPLGTSTAVIEAERAIEQLLRAARPILLIGEAGTGHEIAARAVPVPDTALVERFWREISSSQRTQATLHSGAVAALAAAYWPGNLDHLHSVIANLALTVNSEITADHVRRLLGDSAMLPPAAVAPELTARFFELPLREAREAFERIYFEQLLGKEQSNMSRVAERAGLERTHLYRKLKQLNIRFARRSDESAC